MEIEILKSYDSLGRPTTKEKAEEESQKLKEACETEYEMKVAELIASIPEEFSMLEKVAYIYRYFVDNFEYDYQVFDNLTEYGYAQPISYPYWNKWGVGAHEKYAPIFFKKGICLGLAYAFMDICQKMEIPCEIINGETRLIDEKKQIYLKHSWNMVEVDGEKGHVDVTYGIFEHDKGNDSEKFFFLDNKNLKETGPHHNFDENKVVKNYHSR